MGFARPSGRGGSPIDALRLAQNGLLAAFLVTVMVTDWRWTRIPNYLTYPGILIGLALSAFSGWGAVGVTGLLDHGVAVGAAFLLCYPMYALGWMKAGDVKLLMTVGALRGTVFLLAAGLYGSLLGGLLAIALIVGRRLIPPERPQGGRVRTVLRSSIPYGVALGAGGLVALFVDLMAA